MHDAAANRSRALRRMSAAAAGGATCPVAAGASPAASPASWVGRPVARWAMGAVLAD
ncbi:MAG: hypothetical protein M0040_03370 [Actinomycetota bacterium]|nr:hypothetical protein [Actinomycetota bacterium]